ncbi:MAG: SHOCT domain-containing protein [Cyclobacteriaceae bacterium]
MGYSDFWDLPFIWIVLLGVILISIIVLWIISNRNTRTSRFYSRQRALKDLDQRFEAGEISKEQYDELKAKVIQEYL